jgi:hypothetical protein
MNATMPITRIIFFTCALYSVNALSEEMTRTRWMDLFSTAMPTWACSEGRYFRECFTVTAEQCEKTASSATRICLEKEKGNLPDIFRTKEESANWGRTVGECTGTTKELALMSKRISNAKCNDPKQWETK